MLVLLVLGLLHAHLLWYGDMLVPLALSGAVVFSFPPALAWLARGPRRPGLRHRFGRDRSRRSPTWSTAQSDPAALAAWRAQWTPLSGDDRPRDRPVPRRGGLEQMGQRVPAALETEIVDFVTRLLWQMGGLMLVGMALFKLGVLSAVRFLAFSIYVWGPSGSGPARC